MRPSLPHMSPGTNSHPSPVHGEGGREGRRSSLIVDAGMLCRAARPPASRKPLPSFSNLVSTAGLHGSRCWFAGCFKRIPGPSHASDSRLLTWSRGTRHGVYNLALVLAGHGRLGDCERPEHTSLPPPSTSIPPSTASEDQHPVVSLTHTHTHTHIHHNPVAHTPPNLTQSITHPIIISRPPLLSQAAKPTHPTTPLPHRRARPTKMGKSKMDDAAAERIRKARGDKVPPPHPFPTGALPILGSVLDGASREPHTPRYSCPAATR